MKRNPITILYVLLSAYIYVLLRESGHLLVGLTLKMPLTSDWTYRILPAFAVDAAATGNIRGRSMIILAGPAATLIAGYVLILLMVRGNRPDKRPLRLISGLTCYLALILDPIYFAVVPLARLGGEPERLASLLDVEATPMVAAALVILVVNLILIRTRLVPFLKAP